LSVMGYSKLTIPLITILVMQVFVSVAFMDGSKAQVSPDVYIGVDISYGDVSEAKALIDQVNSFTNLIVIGTTKITWFPDKVNETLQYAYDKGLSFISLPPSLPDYSSTKVNKTEWYKYAYSMWGDRLLGFYYMDEPGGKQLDKVQQLTGNLSSQSSYAEVADRFTEILSYGIDSDLRSSYSYKSFTSDYALYWFDYNAGYDTIFAQFGWNYSRELNIALCRGAATVHNKDWGAIVTWTYTGPPYIESGEELYEDLILTYDNGAKYIVVFDGNEGWTGGILKQEHLDALQQFWNYVKTNPRKSTLSSGRSAYVLPEAYGFGFRGPEDHIWGIWEADDLSYNMSINVASLLSYYGEKLDIIYEDGLQAGNSYGYNQLISWDSYSPPPPKILILSPANITYTESNVTLTFAVDKEVTWIAYSLDNQAQKIIDGNITLSNMADGPHNITVFAKDEFDSLGVSETISFSVDIPEPFPTALVAFAIAASAALGAGLIFYIKRRQ
jgi:hypothetical protein